MEQHKDRTGAVELFREAWALALVKVGAAEDEAGKILARAGELAGLKPEEVRRLVKDFGERLSTQRRDIERTLDEGVNRALTRVKVPRRQELDALRARTARLGERIEALKSRRAQS